MVTHSGGSAAWQECWHEYARILGDDLQAVSPTGVFQALFAPLKRHGKRSS